MILNQSNNSSTSESGYTLSDLGWNAHFEQKFSELGQSELVPVRIAVQQKNSYVLLSENGELSGQLSGRFRHHAKEKSDFPTVGDWAAARLVDQDRKAVIHSLLPRTSGFSRKLPISGGRKISTFEGALMQMGGVTGEQVVAANIDTVFLTVSLDRDLSLRRIERLFMLAYNSGAEPVLVLNKADLCDQVAVKLEEARIAAPGASILVVSAETGQGVEQLRAYCSPGRTVSFIGTSGVGKSSLINYLLGRERQKVLPISNAVGKGMHTTTYREIIPLPSGGLLLDTPGMREFQLWGEEEDLSKNFEDIENLVRKCRYSDCRHESEPDCAVKMALERGELDIRRFRSYQKLGRELRYLSTRKRGRS